MAKQSTQEAGSAGNWSLCQIHVTRALKCLGPIASLFLFVAQEGPHSMSHCYGVLPCGTEVSRAQCPAASLTTGFSFPAVVLTTSPQCTSVKSFTFNTLWKGGMTSFLCLGYWGQPSQAGVGNMQTYRQLPTPLAAAPCTMVSCKSDSDVSENRCQRRRNPWRVSTCFKWFSKQLKCCGMSRDRIHFSRAIFKPHSSQGHLVPSAFLCNASFQEKCWWVFWDGGTWPFWLNLPKGFFAQWMSPATKTAIRAPLLLSHPALPLHAQLFL